MPWHIVFSNDQPIAIVPPGGDVEAVRDQHRRYLQHHYGEAQASGTIIHVKDVPLDGCEVIPTKHMFLVDPCPPDDGERARRRTTQLERSLKRSS